MGKNKFQYQKKKNKKKIFQGDKGYCYIPYDYITNPNYCFDVWTVRKLATDNFGRDHWDIHDTINHTHIHNHKNHWVHINVDDDGRVIEVINEDDDHNRKNDFNDHSNQFRRHGGGLFIIFVLLPHIFDLLLGNNHFKHDDQHHHRHEGKFLKQMYRINITKLSQDIMVIEIFIAINFQNRIIFVSI